jgi:hypothetical protein
MIFSQPINSLIRKRFSCRSYETPPLQDSDRQALSNFLNELPPGPQGGRPRFILTAATVQDRSALRGLSTYGFIKSAPAFIMGALSPSVGDMEDYGYLMEAAVLRATDLGLGTCWLGGTFAHSSFAAKIDLQPGEILPAVVPTGTISTRRYPPADLIRRAAGSDSRLDGSALFFEGDFSTPLSPKQAGAYAEALEMVRLGPSASNKQPWRVLHIGSAWHFYLKRTPGYNTGLSSRFVHADLQRVDMGIAMCHFALSAAELGLKGSWQVTPPPQTPDTQVEYSLTWVAA